MEELHKILINLLVHDSWKYSYVCDRGIHSSIITKKSESFDIIFIDTEFIKDNALILFPLELCNIILSYACFICIPNIKNSITLDSYYLVFCNQPVYKDKIRLTMSFGNYFYYIDYFADNINESPPYKHTAVISYIYNGPEIDIRDLRSIRAQNTNQEVPEYNNYAILYDEYIKKYIILTKFGYKSGARILAKDCYINNLYSFPKCNFLKNFRQSIKLTDLDFDRNIYIVNDNSHLLTFKIEEIMTKSMHNYIINQLELVVDFMQTINLVIIKKMYDGIALCDIRH